jgi:hypothetical protein
MRAAAETSNPAQKRGMTDWTKAFLSIGTKVAAEGF